MSSTSWARASPQVKWRAVSRERCSRSWTRSSRELDEHQDSEKAFEKIEDLQAKVTDAVEKGEIASHVRAEAINEALDEFAASLPDLA
jgi:hypothetical protein